MPASGGIFWIAILELMSIIDGVEIYLLQKLNHLTFSLAVYIPYKEKMVLKN